MGRTQGSKNKPKIVHGGISIPAIPKKLFDSDVEFDAEIGKVTQLNVIESREPKTFAEATKEIVANFVNIAEISQVPVEHIPELRKSIRYDAIFGIRAFRNGQWKGLWELVKLDNEGNRKVIIDATSRQSMMGMLNREVTRIVIGQ